MPCNTAKVKSRSNCNPICCVVGSLLSLLLPAGVPFAAGLPTPQYKMLRYESTFQIKFEDGSEPIEADEAAVRLFSSCARGLPDNASTWPIGSLLCDGKPFSRETVIGWLNMVYNYIHGCAFDRAGPFSNNIVTAAPGDAPAVAAQQLYQLLAFAHAVGSSAGIYQAAMAHATNLKLQANVRGKTVDIAMSGVGYALRHDYGFLEDDRYRRHIMTSRNEMVARFQASDGPWEQLIQDQVAPQLEQLLYMASKLQLRPLLDKVWTFLYVNSGVQSSSVCNKSILPDQFAEVVFSERVVGVLCTDAAAKQAWINSSLQHEFSFVPGKAAVVLQPVLQPSMMACERPPPISFKAVLQQDFLGTKAGEEVDVTLDLMNTSTLSVTHKSTGNRVLPVSISINAGRKKA